MAGRPEFVPTDEHRNIIVTGIAFGMSLERIARLIKVAPMTLTKHFAEEIACAKDGKQLQNWQRIEKSADDGNVSAQKYIDQVLRMSAGGVTVKKAPPLGKKEALNQAAITAAEGTDWSTLVVRKNAN